MHSSKGAGSGIHLSAIGRPAGLAALASQSRRCWRQELAGSFVSFRWFTKCIQSTRLLGFIRSCTTRSRVVESIVVVTLVRSVSHHEVKLQCSISRRPLGGAWRRPLGAATEALRARCEAIHSAVWTFPVAAPTRRAPARRTPARCAPARRRAGIPLGSAAAKALAPPGKRDHSAQSALPIACATTRTIRLRPCVPRHIIIIIIREIIGRQAPRLVLIVMVRLISPWMGTFMSIPWSGSACQCQC